MLMTALFATEAFGGVFATRSPKLLINHLIALVAVVAFTGIGSWLVYKLTNLITPLRVSEDQEEEGLDISQHEETVVELAM